MSSDVESIAEMVHEMVSVMYERQRRITQMTYKAGQISSNFTNFGLPPIFILIDELAALLASFTDKKSKNRLVMI